MCLRMFAKVKFLRKREIPILCIFGPTLTSRFSLKMAKIEKNRSSVGKTLAMGLSKYRKINALSPLAFPRKIRLLFALFWLFLAGTNQDQRSKGQNHILNFYQDGSWASLYEKSLVPPLSSFVTIRAKGRFCKILIHFFIFAWLFRYHAQIFHKNKLIFQCKI